MSSDNENNSDEINEKNETKKINLDEEEYEVEENDEIDDTFSQEKEKIMIVIMKKVNQKKNKQKKMIIMNQKIQMKIMAAVKAKIIPKMNYQRK